MGKNESVVHWSINQTVEVQKYRMVTKSLRTGITSVTPWIENESLVDQQIERENREYENIYIHHKEYFH